MLLSLPPLLPFKLQGCSMYLCRRTKPSLRPNEEWKNKERGMSSKRRRAVEKKARTCNHALLSLFTSLSFPSQKCEKKYVFFFFEPLCGMQLGLSSEHNIRYLHLLLLLLFPLYTSAADAIKFHSPVLIAGHKIPLRKTLPLPKEKNFFFA